MLSKSSIKAGYKLSKSLNKRGQTFYIKKGSLIDELIKTNLESVSVNGETPTEEEMFKALEAATTDSDDNHDTLLTNYVNDISDKASKMLSHTINVVAYEVLRLRDKFLELNGDDGDDESKPQSFFNVSFVSAPELVNTPFMHEMLESVKEDEMGYKRTPMPNLEQIISNLPPSTEETLTMGIGYVDDCIKQWLASSDILQRYFHDVGNIQRIIGDAEALPDATIVRRTAKDFRYNTLEFALINLLFYRKISTIRDDNGEYIKDTTVPAHNNFRFWSYVVKKRLIAYRKAVGAGKIISPIGTDHDLISVLATENSAPKQIVCYTDSIRKLSDRSVDITSLFGYVLDGNDYLNLTIDELTENRERYENIYESKVSNLRYVKRKATIARTKWNLKRAYSECFKSSLKEGSEQGVFDSEKDESLKIDYIGDLDKDGVSIKVSSYIDGLKADGNNLLIDICIDIIAGIRYNNYPAKYYLRLFKSGVQDFEFSEDKARKVVSDYIGTFLLDNVEIADK